MALHPADSRLAVLAGRVVFLAGLGVLVETGVRSGWIDSQVMAAPTDVFQASGDLVADGSFRSDLLLTMWQVGLGFGGSVALGSVSALVAWRWPAARHTLMPYVLLANSFPLILLYPVFVVIFGLGTASIFVLALSLGTMPMFVSALAGLDGIPRAYLELADSVGCVGRRRFTKVLLPAARGLVLNGLRQAFVYVLIIVVAAQYILAGNGLGHTIRRSYELFKVPELYAGIVIVVAISFVGDQLLRLALRER